MERSDYKAAFLILESSEQARPVEFLAQYIASYIVSGDLTSHDAAEFLVSVAIRMADLVKDPSEIWETLLPGGIIADDHIPKFEVIERGEFSGVTTAPNDPRHVEQVVNHIANLDQDQVEEIATTLYSWPNIGMPGGTVDPDAEIKTLAMHDIQATDLLRKALGSGQLQGTLIAREIMLFFDEDMDDPAESPNNIVLHGKWRVKPDEDTTLYTSNVEFFMDEQGVQWLKFVPNNGHDRGKEHVMRSDSIYAVVKEVSKVTS